MLWAVGVCFGRVRAPVVAYSYFCRRADALMAGQHARAEDPLEIDAEWLEALARQSLEKPGQWLHQMVDLFSPSLSAV